jgi:hypothetical protein
MINTVFILGQLYQLRFSSEEFKLSLKKGSAKSGK